MLCPMSDAIDQIRECHPDEVEDADRSTTHANANNLYLLLKRVKFSPKFFVWYIGLVRLYN